jgi:hypothetical protein
MQIYKDKFGYSQLLFLGSVPRINYHIAFVLCPRIIIKTFDFYKHLQCPFLGTLLFFFDINQKKFNLINMDNLIIIINIYYNNYLKLVIL